MAWGSERSAVDDFARELRCFRDEHGTPTIADIKTATEDLTRPRADGTPSAGALSETLSAGRISDVMMGHGVNPPTAAMVFSFARAILHLEDPTADPITPSHPDVWELLTLRSKAFARQDLGTFRERHLRTALQNSDAANTRHGCFALYALDGTTLHIGSTASETLAVRIETLLNPAAQIVNREHVAELELWPMPHLATDPDAEAIVTRAEETLTLKALYASAPPTLRLPRGNPEDEPTLPKSKLFPLIDSGTLLAVREALRDQAAHLANQANAHYARTETLFRRQRNAARSAD